MGGHFSRNCPKWDNKCRYCKMEGHMLKDCPEKQKLKCYKCKGQGHISRACEQVELQTKPSSQPEGTVKKISCYKCMEEGHLSRSCPNPKKNRKEGDKFSGVQKKALKGVRNGAMKNWRKNTTNKKATTK